MMHSTLVTLFPLAQLSGWRHYGYREYTGVYSESNSGKAWTVLGLTALLVVGVLLWHFLASRTRGRISSNSPHALFRELCRAHGLNHAHRRLLKRLASVRGVPCAAVLFVQPECFDVASLPDNWQEQADEIAQLGERLFGPSDR